MPGVERLDQEGKMEGDGKAAGLWVRMGPRGREGGTNLRAGGGSRVLVARSGQGRRWGLRAEEMGPGPGDKSLGV